MERRQELHNTRIRSVIDYFEENWHCIKDEWVEGLKSKFMTLRNRTNNRLECINQKVKSVCSKYASLEQCFTELFIVLNSLNTERDSRAAEVATKKCGLSFPDGSVEAKYAHYLTPYSFGYVHKELQLSLQIKDFEQVDDEHAIFNMSRGPITTTMKSCECSFFVTMGLPCRHMFSFRKYHGVDMYDETMVLVRWTRLYYIGKHRVYNIFNDSQSRSCLSKFSQASTTTKNIKSSHEKYREAFEICKSLATMLSEMPMRDYVHNIQELKQLKDAWQSNTPVRVETLDEGNQNSLVNDMETEGKFGENFPKFRCFTKPNGIFQNCLPCLEKVTA